MQILTIWTKFEAFKRKFAPFKQDSKDLRTTSNHSKGIQSIELKF